MKKIISTLRALVEVMEALSKDADPSGVGGLIAEEVLLHIILRCLS
jgi:callose synthase